LGRYTHRVAIANHRLVSMENGMVSFRWKDYRHPNKQKLMILPAEEFIRRFLLHALPSGFQRIRHYGWLGNRHRAAKLALCRRLLALSPAPRIVPAQRTDYRAQYEHLTGQSLVRCPVCSQGRMVRVETVPALLKCDLGTRGDTS